MQIEATWSCSDANTSVVGVGMGAGVELDWGILESSSSGVGVFNSLVEEEEPGDPFTFTLLELAASGCWGAIRQGSIYQEVWTSTFSQFLSRRERTASSPEMTCHHLTTRLSSPAVLNFLWLVECVYWTVNMIIPRRCRWRTYNPRPYVHEKTALISHLHAPEAPLYQYLLCTLEQV